MKNNENLIKILDMIEKKGNAYSYSILSERMEDSEFDAFLRATVEIINEDIPSEDDKLLLFEANDVYALITSTSKELKKSINRELLDPQYVSIVSSNSESLLKFKKELEDIMDDKSEHAEEILNNANNRL